jgi:hypothetical protein
MKRKYILGNLKTSRVSVGSYILERGISETPQNDENVLVDNLQTTIFPASDLSRLTYC